jgi:hypothetical protein
VGTFLKTTGSLKKLRSDAKAIRTSDYYA